MQLRKKQEQNAQLHRLQETQRIRHRASLRHHSQSEDVSDFLSSILGQSPRRQDPVVPQAESRQPVVRVLREPASKPFRSTINRTCSCSGPAVPAKSAVPAPKPAPERTFRVRFAVPEGPQSPPKSDTSSLKNKLEEKLRSASSDKLKIRIQGLLEALALAENQSSAPAGGSQAEKVQSSEAGIAQDVAHAFDVVSSIQSAFYALVAGFQFPSHIDFAVQRSSDEASSESDSSSTSKLAFTSTNHVVKYYEQALTNLLLQLDSVESFGNEALRALRKNTVGKVEKAIEDLEREIESQWREKVSKEQPFAPAQAASESTSSAQVASSDQYLPRTQHLLKRRQYHL
ncbi:hypothetical protein C8J56DRAFT_236242 [Mycena floridula]|nr:hypothetical protein C8J56DRAFT_236242 [Mycena floridula]